MLLNNQWVIGEIKRNHKIPRDKLKQKYDILKSLGCSKSCSKRDRGLRNRGLPKEKKVK